MIKIGLIDSGINIGHNSINKEQILNAIVINGNNFDDNIGHGTSCAYLIQQINPDCLIYNIKVFDKQLKTSVKNLLQGIRWCIDNGINIINISISTSNLENYYEIFEICEEAVKKKIIIISSGNNLGTPVLPAYVESVIGVGAAENIYNNEYYYKKDSPIQFYAKGDIQIVPDITNNCISSKGSSLATANMTGIISKIYDKNHQISLIELKNILKFNALEFNSKNIVLTYVDFNLTECTKPIKFRNHILNNIFGIKTAHLLSNNPFEKGLYKKFKKLLNFSVVERISDSKNIKVDTIIINECSFKEDILASYKNIFINCTNSNLFKTKFDNRNIFSLNRNLGHINKYIDKIHPNHLYKNKVPVLAIINIGLYPFIFDFELDIREKLKNKNVKTSHIGSYPFSEFFDCNFSMPNINEIKKLSFNTLLKFPKVFIETINNTDKYDIIIFGLNYNSLQEKESSIINDILLNSIQPDIVSFVINDMDQFEIIEKNADKIFSAYSNFKYVFVKNTINFGLIDSKSIYNSIVKEGVEKYRNEFFEKIKKRIENKYKTTVFDVSNKKDDTLLINYILKHTY